MQKLQREQDALEKLFAEAGETLKEEHECNDMLANDERERQRIAKLVEGMPAAASFLLDMD